MKKLAILIILLVFYVAVAYSTINRRMGFPTDLTIGGDLTVAGDLIDGSDVISLKTIIKTVDVDDDASTDDYQLDDDAENANEQVITLTNILPAYAELVSVQIRCIETVTGSAVMAIDFGTSSGGGELVATGDIDTANDLSGTEAGANPEAAALNTADTLYVNFKPDDNWNTLDAGRWAIMISYIDYGAVYTNN
ncbi:MAG: hypothetical protein ACTSYW_02585 [Candidatus Heimdallarchaeota archaeon]